MQNQKRKNLSGQKVNNAVLKNKINRDLYLVGKNSILQVFHENWEAFECLILSGSHNSEKGKEITALFKSKGIPVLFDSNSLDFVENNFNIDTGGVLVLLNTKIGTVYSFSEVESLLEKMEICTIVALPDIDYEQNIGAMIRTSLGLNVDMILISNRQQKVFSPTVTKVSMGYNYSLPIVQENFLLAIQKLRELDFDIIATDMKGEKIQKMYYNPRTCFVMGNEGGGISPTVLSKCTKTLSIPMSNGVESLNVATSLGIVLYDRMVKLK